MGDDMKFFLMSMLVFATIVWVIGTAVQRSELEDCKDLQALYGDVVTWEQGFLSTRCYATMPNGYLYRLDLYGVNDHVLLREITE